MLLEDVEEAIRTNDFGIALERAIQTWQKHRYAVLADLVHAIERHLPAAQPLPRDQQEFQAEWLQRARQGNKTTPLDSLLLASLSRSIPMSQRYSWAQGTLHHLDGAERYAAWLARVEVILDRPHDDPRAALAAFHVLEKAPFAAGGEEAFIVYGPLLTILERTDDERVLPLLERLIQLPTAARQMVRRYYKTALPRVKEKLERSQSIRRPIDPALSERAQALIEQLGGATTATSSSSSSPVRDDSEDEASLLEMVIEDPDDDAARAVLADFWLERNDPRGELINLQLKEARGEATAHDLKSIRSLLRAHEKGWLSELALVTKRRVFRRGFLDEVELQQNSAADPEVWEATTKSPLLATVRVLRKGKANEQHYRSFLFSPALKSLRSLSLPRKAMLDDALLRSDPPWPIRELVLTFAPERTELETLTNVKKKTFPLLTKVTLGVKPGRVKKVIDLAKKLDPAGLSCIAVTPVSWYNNEDTSELVEWLRAVTQKLGHLPAVEIVFFVGLREDRLIATRGAHKKDALILDFVGESLYFIDPMLRALEPSEVEHLRLRSHPEDDAPTTTTTRSTPHADLRLRATVERFGGKKAVDLDEGWSRAHAAS
jgi:uncharacterized protein (TIGR02996 family)